MNFSSFPDVFSWIENLPPIDQWKTNSNFINLCPLSSSQPSLKLSITNFTNSHLSLSIVAYYNVPISLWTSKKLVPKSKRLHDESTISTLIHNFIEDVLKYSPNKCPSSLKLPISQTNPKKDIFNFSFLTLAFIVCIYEAPTDLRASCLNTFKDQLACPKSRGVSKVLMRILGSNIEEEWMRSVNLAITNWISEIQATNNPLKTPCSLFSYSLSLLGLWKVQLYCPVIAMNIQKSSGSSPDDHLMFTLNFHQLEGVIQLNYRVTVQEKYIEIKMNTDNIR